MAKIARHVLALACLASAGVHLSLVHGHADTDPALSAAFITAAAGLGLAGLLALAGRDVAIGALVLLAGAIGAYALDRAGGLPIAPEHDAAHGGIDALGLATKGIEAVGVAAALALLRLRLPRRIRHAPGTEAVRPAA